MTDCIATTESSLDRRFDVARMLRILDCTRMAATLVFLITRSSSKHSRKGLNTNRAVAFVLKFVLCVCMRTCVCVCVCVFD